jgi:hypothetical protein
MEKETPHDVISRDSDAYSEVKCPPASRRHFPALLFVDCMWPWGRREQPLDEALMGDVQCHPLEEEHCTTKSVGAHSLGASYDDGEHAKVGGKWA